MIVATIIQKLQPIRVKIVALSVFLALLTQIVLMSIGLSYLKNLDRQTKQNREVEVVNTIRLNMVEKRNSINNLMQLLQTSDINDFFLRFMNLREEPEVQKQTRELNDKLNEIDLAHQGVKSLYFIGANRNQASMLKQANSDELIKLDRMSMDDLHEIGLDATFLKSHDRLELFTNQELNKVLKSNTNEAHIKSFIDAVSGRIIISNGNASGVLLIAVLNPDFLRSALPDNLSEEYGFMIINDQQKRLWSTLNMENYASGSVINVALLPFREQLVIMNKHMTGQKSETQMKVRFWVLALITVAITAIISFYLAKQISKPFQLIANKLNVQPRDSGLNLRAIPEQLYNRGLHRFTMRTKLILVFVLAVILPSVSDGVLFTRMMNQYTNEQLAILHDEKSELRQSSISSNSWFYSNLISQLSQHLQPGISFKRSENNQSFLDATTLSLSTFPGLNEISYCVLLDANGKSMFSSMFLNNSELFSVSKSVLQDQAEPFWLTNFKDIYGKSTVAIVKRINTQLNQPSSLYLLLVPKQNIFEEASISGLSIRMWDGDKPFYVSSDFVNINKPAQPNQTIGSWKLETQYANDNLIQLKKESTDRFTTMIVIVLLVSVLLSLLISAVLVRPLQRLKEAMLLAGLGDLNQQVDYESHNEIGEIIQSYNQMIGKLNTAIQDNALIMEENAMSKARENELVTLKTKSELQMLQAQINPHFLYNTLETINMRSMKTGSMEVSTIVTSLADLMRYSTNVESDTATLEQELKHVTNYIAIQQIRLGNSFQFEVDVHESLLKQKVVKFILQPIVENAVKYAFVGFDEGEGRILRIHASLNDEEMEIMVQDNGIGMSKFELEQLNTRIQYGGLSPSAQSDKASGIGLRNVYQRLSLYYKAPIQLNVMSEPMKGTTVQFVFPIL